MAAIKPGERKEERKDKQILASRLALRKRIQPEKGRIRVYKDGERKRIRDWGGSRGERMRREGYDDGKGDEM